MSALNIARVDDGEDGRDRGDLGREAISPCEDTSVRQHGERRTDIVNIYPRTQQVANVPRPISPYGRTLDGPIGSALGS